MSLEHPAMAMYVGQTDARSMASPLRTRSQFFPRSHLGATSDSLISSPQLLCTLELERAGPWGTPMPPERPGGGPREQVGVPSLVYRAARREHRNEARQHPQGVNGGVGQLGLSPSCRLRRMPPRLRHVAAKDMEATAKTCDALAASPPLVGRCMLEKMCEASLPPMPTDRFDRARVPQHRAARQARRSFPAVRCTAFASVASGIAVVDWLDMPSC